VPDATSEHIVDVSTAPTARSLPHLDRVLKINQLDTITDDAIKAAAAILANCN